MTVISDFTLLQAARKGQEGSFQELCRRKRADLGIFAAHLLKGHQGPTSADDVVVTVYADLWETFRKEPERAAKVGDFASYCKTLIREVVADLRAARDEDPPPADPPAAELDEPPAEPVPGPVSPPGETPMAPDELAKKIQALRDAGSSGFHQLVFKLRREGKSLNAIADEVGSNAKTVGRALEDCVRFFEAERLGTDAPEWPNREKKRRPNKAKAPAAGVPVQPSTPARKKPGPKKKDPSVTYPELLRVARRHLDAQVADLRIELDAEFERRRALLDRSFVAQVDKLLAWKE